MTFQAREKKMILFGTLFCVVFLIVKLLVIPFTERGDLLKESIESKKELLFRYQLALARGPYLDSKRDGLREAVNLLEEGLIAGETPALASAQLQSILEEIAKQGKTSLKRIKTLDAVDLGDYARIGVEIVFIAEIRPLMNMLYEVENNKKTLSITRLDIHLQDLRNDNRLRTILRVEGGIKKLEMPHSAGKTEKALAVKG